MTVYFTFFSSSLALASLVSTLVWSTMLSVDRRRGIIKSMADKRKVFQTSHLRRCLAVKASHPSVWHTEVYAHSKRPMPSLFSLIAPFRAGICEMIVETSHYNGLLSVARHLYTSLTVKPPIHTHTHTFSRVCGSVPISLDVLDISHHGLYSVSERLWKKEKTD